MLLKRRDLDELRIVRHDATRRILVGPDTLSTVTMSKWHWEVYDWLLSETGTCADFIFDVKEVIDEDGLTQGFDFNQHIMWFIECYFQSYIEALDL